MIDNSFVRPQQEEATKGREESWGTNSSQTSTLGESLQKDRSIGRNIPYLLPALVSQLGLGILLGRRKVPSLFLVILQLLFLNWRNASLPRLLYTPPLSTHARTHAHRDKLLICIWDVDYRGILYINLEGPVLPGLSLQSTNFPSFFHCVCQWKKLANPIYKYFCLLALCLMLRY